MPTNVYINSFDSSAEQRLVEDLITESIKFYGRDFYYIPRKKSDDFDQIYGEDPRKSFPYAHIIEMYVKNVEGFAGERDIVGRFGLEIRDQTTLTVASRRFGDLITANPHLSGMGITRPREGDLIYFDFTQPDPTTGEKQGQFLEIQFVDDEAIYYQAGGLQVYDLRCETFTYSNEDFSTGVEAIDRAFSNTTSTLVYTGNTMPSDVTADNTLIETEANQVLDLSEDSPFGDFG
tara:strand:+ start:1403 stop:2104 length:702 start_codon:yes stop_codon:yes gene_type:complete